MVTGPREEQSAAQEAKLWARKFKSLWTKWANQDEQDESKIDLMSATVSSISQSEHSETWFNALMTIWEWASKITYFNWSLEASLAAKRVAWASAYVDEPLTLESVQAYNNFPNSSLHTAARKTLWFLTSTSTLIFNQPWGGGCQEEGGDWSLSSHALWCGCPRIC